MTLALMIVASAAVEVAAEDRSSLAASLGAALLWAAPAVVLGRLLPAPAVGRRTPPRFVMLALVAFAAAPFVTDPFRRAWAGEGHPLEIQMVLALRNLGLGLAACSAWRTCLRLAGAVSLFLMLFAVSLADSWAVVVLLGLYGAAGGAWLMIVYWAGLRQTVAAHTTTVVEAGRRRRGLPWFPAVCLLGAAGCAAALFVVGPRAAAQMLGEWLPTSGGTGEFDPFARGGINDGDEVVGGDNAQGTGMVDANRALNSPLPSIYDMIDDVYGEPFKPPETERAVALDTGLPRSRERRKPPPDSLHPSREFSTSRRGPEHPRDTADRAARALFEVQGRTPLHVRATAFDAFDGVAWQEVPFDPSTCLLDAESDGCWMAVRELKPPDVFAATEDHQLKIAGDVGSLVPAPPHLTRFRLGLVNEVSFFAWGRERVLRMAHRKTPGGVVVRTQSRVIDPRRLPDVRFLTGGIGPEAPGGVASDLDPDVKALAREWAAGRPHGWAQVEAVLGHLRSDYALDSAAAVSADCADPLRHFLLEARRGPDYQFASAAAVLLRLLNYRTRLVGGFYAAPDRYDPETEHTPVGPDDLHFWAEVMLPGGDWLVLEPTPGYEVLRPAPNWAERAWAVLVAAGLAVGRHPALATFTVIALVVLWRRRLALLEAAILVLWDVFPGRGWRLPLSRARWLLERRGRWAGRPRPESQTFGTWLISAPPPAGPAADDLARLRRMAEWAAYAPDLEPPWDEGDVRGVCRRVLRAWTLKRWRAALTAGGGR